MAENLKVERVEIRAFECPACGNALRITHGVAGRRARCPSCDEVVQLPEAPAEEAPETAAALDRPERKKVGWGIASFVSGVLGFPLLFLSVGVLLGACALLFHRFQRRHGTTGLARAGMVVGIVDISLAAVFSFALSSKALEWQYDTIKPPARVLAQKVERIDARDLTVMTFTMGEWAELGSRRGNYRNPDTGEFTMVLPMECVSCRQIIPQPKFPLERFDMDESTTEEERQAYYRGVNKVRSEYECPKCGNIAFEDLERVQGGMFHGPPRPRADGRPTEGRGPQTDR